jgi:RHS repeat-associated protein
VKGKRRLKDVASVSGEQMNHSLNAKLCCHPMTGSISALLITLFLTLSPYAAHADVNSVGAFVDAVQINVSPFHRLEPNLVLAYNSQRGKGTLGVGWKIEGLSEIRRLSSSKGSARFDADDRFFVDGNELIPCPTSVPRSGLERASCLYPGVSGRAFTSRRESFERISLTDESTGGLWIIWDRSGTKKTYKLSSSRTVWQISVVEDLHGNRVEYSYKTPLNSQSAPQEIDEISYGGTTIKFHWKTRPDSYTQANGSSLHQINYRLAVIEVRAHGNVARAYALSYAQHANAKQSVLKEIREFGTDARIDSLGIVSGTSHPPTILQYETEPRGGPNQWERVLATSPHKGPALDTNPRRPTVSRDYHLIPAEHCSPVGLSQIVNGDFDGDGRTDSVTVVQCGSNAELTFFGANGASTKSVFQFDETATWPAYEAYRNAFQVLVADVDGDGRQDIILLTMQLLSQYSHFGPLEVLINVAISDGNGSFHLAQPDFRPTGWISAGGIDFIAPHCATGDFRGARRADLVCIFQDNFGDQYIGRAYARRDGSLISTEGVLFKQSPWPVPHTPGNQNTQLLVTLPIAAGDVNADGLTDLILLDPNPSQLSNCPFDDRFNCEIRYDLVIGQSNGTDFEFSRQATTWRYSFSEGGSSVYAADLNADGRADIIAIPGRYSSNAPRLVEIGTAIALPNGEFKLRTQTVPQNLSVVEAAWTFGDVDGDGATDLLVVTPVRPGSGMGCSGFQQTRPVLTEVRSNGDGTFAFPERWDDCNISREMTMPWSELQTIGGVRAADTNGDGLADFYLVFAKSYNSSSGYLIAFADDVAKPTGLNTNRWVASDLNGDGRTDFLMILPREQQTEVASLIRMDDGRYAAKSMSLPRFDNPSANTWKIADVNSDGQSDLVHVQCIRLPIWFSRGCLLEIDTFIGFGDGTFNQLPRATFHTGHLFGLAEANSSAWRILDLDGKGRPALVFVGSFSGSTDGGVFVHSLSFEENWMDLGVAGPFKLSGGGVFNSALSDTLNWFPADIDGDKRTDLVHVVSDFGGNRLTTLRSLGRNQWELVDANLINSTSLPWRLYPGVQSTLRWRVVDVNGDGLSDLVRTLPTSNGMLVQTLFSVGDGKKWEEAVTGIDLSAVPDAMTVAGAVDWMVSNRDESGFPELIRVASSSNRLANLTRLLSDGAGRWDLQQQESFDPSRFGLPQGRVWSIADLDGDGRKDLIRIDMSADVDATLDIAALVARNWRPLLVKWTSAQGSSTNIKYSASSSFQRSDLAHGCMLPIGLIVSMVKELDIFDGKNEVAREVNSYAYRCPHWIADERYFSGWSEISVSLPGSQHREAVQQRRSYAHKPDCGALLQGIQFRDINNNRAGTEKAISYEFAVDSPWFCLPSRVTEVHYGSTLSWHTKHTTFIYDLFGNATDVREGGSAVAGIDTRTTLTTFKPNTTAFITASPSTQNLYAGLGGDRQLVRSRRFCYDGDVTDTCDTQPTRGLVTALHELVVAGQADVRTTRYGYYDNGNVSGVTNANNHQTQYIYDPDYRVYPILTINALGQTESEIFWDFSISRPTHIKLGNKQPLKIDYDVLARPKTLTLPDGGIVQREYLDFGNPTKQAVRDALMDGSANGLWTKRYLDGFGREYQTDRKGNHFWEIFRRETQFADSTSLVFKASDWFCVSWWPFCGPKDSGTETYGYDGVGRLKKITRGDLSTVTYSRDIEPTRLLTRKTDENNTASDLLHDVFGRLGSARAAYQAQQAESTYIYNAADDLIQASDPLGNVTTFSRNLLGQVNSVDDPDLGLRRYFYDAVGNLHHSFDAKNAEVTYSYDELERVQTKSYPNGRTFTYVYDEVTGGASQGQLTSVFDSMATRCDNNKIEGITHDSAGRVSRRKICVGGISNAFGFRYDEFGRTRAVEYPDGETVIYRYDRSGRPSALSGIVDHIKYDAANRPRSIRYSNGVFSRLRYNPDRGTLRTQSVWSDGKQIFDMGFEYYPNLQIKSVSSYSDNTKYNYSYDSLNRLESIAGNLNEIYSYDLAGNMSHRSGLGSYTYLPQGPMGCSPDGQTPLACKSPRGVRNAGGYDFFYDQNGNVESTKSPSGAIRVIEWDFEQRPESISDFNGSMTNFDYDAFGRRTFSKTSGGTTRWFAKLGEVDSAGVLTKHYHIGSTRLASKNGTNSTWYTRDYLDSVRAITGSNGEVIAGSSYSPYGNALGNSAGLNFAGHDREPGSTLILMGPRFYDSVIGRMLSPDTIIPSLTSVHGLNRYSYAYNNPLSFIDPSGHEPIGIYEAYQSSATADPYSGFFSNVNFVIVNPIYQAAAYFGASNNFLSYMKDSFKITTKLEASALTAFTGGHPVDFLRLMGKSDQDFVANAVKHGYGTSTDWESLGLLLSAPLSVELGAVEAIEVSGLMLDSLALKLSKFIQSIGSDAGAAKGALREVSPYSLVRTHNISGKTSARNVTKIIESMRSGGWQGGPIEVVEYNGKLYVLDGHHRLFSAKEAPLPSVPVRVVPFESRPGSWKTLEELLNGSAEVGRDNLRLR